MLLIPVVLYLNWELLAPYVAKGIPNPFAPLLFISHPVESSTPDDPRYQKGYLDLVFLAYYVIFWSFVRQFVTLYACLPIARYFGIKKEAKLDRFGEQGYSFVYWGIMGAWGYRIMGQQPTWWYNTEAFWIGYPHWDMKPELKVYYLMQAAFWIQQLFVLVLGLEKPRKDYHELVAHHIVTLWLVGWSYLINLTLIGNAVYMSMDIPDTFLAFSKLLNYMKFTNAKVVSFITFLVSWTYFRHYLNLWILWSVWTEFDLIPETSMQWLPESGAWLAPWMRYQIFAPILLLQFLNIFWYFFMLRILWRAITGTEIDDDRSDDEGDADHDKDE